MKYPEDLSTKEFITQMMYEMENKNELFDIEDVRQEVIDVYFGGVSYEEILETLQREFPENFV